MKDPVRKKLINRIGNVPYQDFRNYYIRKTLRQVTTYIYVYRYSGNKYRNLNPTRSRCGLLKMSIDTSASQKYWS